MTILNVDSAFAIHIEMETRLNGAHINENYNEMLILYMKIIDDQLENEQYEQSFHTMWKALCIVEYTVDENLILKYLHLIQQYSFFLYEDSSYKYMLESLVSRKWQKKEIKSVLLHIISIFDFEKGNYEQAYYAAKLSYNYANNLNSSVQQQYLFQAQLQLLFMTLYTKGVCEAEKLMHHFQLQEIKFLIESLKTDLNEQKLIMFLHTFNTSNGSYNLLYLLNHLRFICSKQLNNNSYLLIEQIYGDMREKLNYNWFLKFSSFNKDKKRVTMHSDLFFRECQIFYQKALLQNEKVWLCYVKLEKHYLEYMKQLMFSEHFVIYQYAENEFLIVCNEHTRSEFIKQMMNIIPRYEICLQMHSKVNHKRFLDVYNDYLEELQEI